MGLIFELEESDFAGFIEDDTVMSAECVQIEQRNAPWETDNGIPDKRISFKFVITEEGPHQGRFLYGETPTTFVSNPNCRLYAWAQEILGSDLPPGYKLDTDVLLGEGCRVVVEYKQYVDKKTGVGWVINFGA